MSVEHNILVAVAWADIIAQAAGRMLPGILITAIILISLWLAGRR